MNFNHRQTSLLTAITLIFIYSFAWYIQTQLFLNADVNSLLVAAEKMLAGGSYVKDIFTPNPPLILYLYMPVVLISHFFQINIIEIFQIYIFLLASLSLLICYSIINKVIKKEPCFPKRIFILVVSILFVLSPEFEFGQRDHLFVILIMPYLLTTALRLNNGIPKKFEAIFVGLLAGIGFGLKPQFLILLATIESYCLWEKKNFLMLLRTELLLILSFILVYYLSIYIFQPDYIFIILPFVLRYYHGSSAATWPRLIFNYVFIFGLIPVIFFCMQRKSIILRPSRHVFFGALLAALSIFVLQHMMYFYHAIPTIFFAVLVIILQFSTFFYTGNFSNSSDKKLYQYCVVLFCSLLLFMIPFFMQYNLHKIGKKYRKNILEPLILFMRSQSVPQSLYMLTPRISFGFPLITYVNAKIVQRFDALWMLNYLYKINNQTIITKQSMGSDESFLIKMVVEDFQKNKPSMVFVINKIVDKAHQIDYLRYFLTNKQFNQEWQAYEYVTTIYFSGYESVLQVYKRHQIH